MEVPFPWTHVASQLAMGFTPTPNCTQLVWHVVSSAAQVVKHAASEACAGDIAVPLTTADVLVDVVICADTDIAATRPATKMVVAENFISEPLSTI